MSLRAQTVTLHLDPAQTRIAFTLGAVLHTVHGTFKLQSGTIKFDPATGVASGEIIADASTGRTGNDGRDRKMHKSVLESQTYPEIVFSPMHVQGRVSFSGTSQVQIQGIFRLHGNEHQVTLPAEIQITGDRLTGELHFTVPYVQWGLKDPSTFVLRVDKKVDLEIHAAGHLIRASAPR